MITIEQVIEQCAQAYEAEAHTWKAWPQAGAAGRQGATAIRALAAQYEGCIVAEGRPHLWIDHVAGTHHPFPNKGWTPLYRAREAK